MQHINLKFDIYERINLEKQSFDEHDDGQDNLTPHVQVIHEGGRWEIVGSLALERKQGKSSLIHLIPVQIALPYERISNPSNVMMIVDKFSLKILTSKSANVTGVVTLYELPEYNESYD